MEGSDNIIMRGRRNDNQGGRSNNCPEKMSVKQYPVKRKLVDSTEETDFILPSKLPKLAHAESEFENKSRKHVRKRQKYLLQAVLDQMEFYFSDSNLSKDRFLKKMMEQSPDGYIDLSVFGNFNKLQTLHKDGVSLKILTKALKQSKILQLSEDKTRVRRLTPLKEISAEETDKRTVYVEYLPPHANHAWIQTTFAACGKVVYVSLPKYQSTGEIKGFAFVEFQTPEEAEKACNMLNNPPPIREGEKPGKFPKGNKTLFRLQKIAPPKPDQDSNEENVADDATDEPKKKKKKKGSSKKKQSSDASSEVVEEEASTSKSASDVAEAKKKKKKKKKKKQGSSQDESSTKEDEDSVLEETARSESLASEKKKMSSKAQEVEEKESKKSTEVETTEETLSKKKKKKKKKKKSARKLSEEDSSVSMKEEKESEASVKQSQKTDDTDDKTESSEKVTSGDSSKSTDPSSGEPASASSAQVSCRSERKRLRQEEIRRKKKERKEQELAAQKQSDTDISGKTSKTAKDDGSGDIDKEEAKNDRRKSDGSELTSILKTERPRLQKKVEFNPVPVTQEFVREREIRKRKKAKKDKLQLRVISKKEWLSLKAEYLQQQKSHMTALKESLRELRQQENQNTTASKPGTKHVDLEDVFGTKRLKPSQDIKMAHVESLKFTPNVIVQWKSSNEMHRDKIRTMFKDISGDSIAYIDAQEEAKTGYIRFKDEQSANNFAKLSRDSTSFSARVLPLNQQQTYWDKANEDRMKKLGRKKQEKGSQRIARKVFERNKTTFHEKPSRICFEDNDNEEEKKQEEENGSQEQAENQSEEASKDKETTPTTPKTEEVAS